MRAAKAVPVKETTEQPELADRFNRVLSETVTALEEAGIQYAFIGGIASGGLGRPRSTHDIDVFVRPEDAEITLRALARHAFRTEKTDPSWLYKGWKENILVDVIFKSKGEIYLDKELYDRTVKAEFHGRSLRLVAPEDLVIIKALAHSELTPGHWHDALALLSHATIDWDYLLRRARKAPRRVLSLLVYAHSNDIWVPRFVIDDLYRAIFGDASLGRGGRPASLSQGLAQGQSQEQVQVQSPAQVPAQPAGGPLPRVPLKVVAAEGYASARLREALARDSRTNELDIEVDQAPGKILLRGEVLTLERKQAAEKLARECCPGFQIENQIRVANITGPMEAEEIE